MKNSPVLILCPCFLSVALIFLKGKILDRKIFDSLQKKSVSLIGLTDKLVQVLKTRCLFYNFSLLYGVFFPVFALVCRKPNAVEQFRGSVEDTATANDDEW